MLKYAGARNAGGRATTTATAKAQQTSIGPRSAPRGTHPGNSAGLRTEKAVRLEHNNSGYANKGNQIARFKRRENIASKAQTIQSSQISAKIHECITDNRLTSSKTSSISRLKKAM